MEKLKLIYHKNYIGREINESLKGYPQNDRRVFCKKLHKLTEPLEKDCKNCEYFAGLMLGYGHECAWEDYQPEVSGNTVEILHENATKELLRVSDLIDKKIVKKG